MAFNKRDRTIFKNTLFLYIRMAVTIIISLYTSRVVLQVLGVNDFGIYQTVGGIVAFISFANNALATGSSRFITYGLGLGDIKALKNIFSTSLTIHICFAVLIVFLAETLGLWFLRSYLIIPEHRLNAAELVFHVSVFTAFFSLTQIPFKASIIAHEKIQVYAYIGIVDASVKLLIAYLITLGNIDKLILYAMLLCLLQVCTMLYYRIYCTKRFEEVSFKLKVDVKTLKEIFCFSGWSLLANSSIALSNQGVLMLLNMFFSPAVVAARTISLQVSGHASQLVINFQTASNPQVVKLYAAKDYEGSKRLLLQTTRLSYYLMLLISLPIILAAEPLLYLWLGQVPEYSVVFLQLVIIEGLFQVFNISFYRAINAKGQLKENALVSPMIIYASFPVIYLCFLWGYSPISLSWVSLVTYAILGVIVKPILVNKIVGYSWNDIFSVFVPCIKVSLASLPLPLFFYYILNREGSTVSYIVQFVSISFVSIITVTVSSLFLGISKQLRTEIINKVKRLA